MEEQKSLNTLYENREFCGSIIRQRISDGYLNATEMCKANGKLYGHYIENKQTREFLKELSSDMEQPIQKLVEVRKGNSKKFSQGTWVHPRVATHLAVWISPKFAVKITRWIEEWKLYSKENQEQYDYELSNLEPSRNFLKEKELRDKYQNILNSEKEVKTDVGYIDLLTKTDLIEIKNATNWKHGIGQLICYGTYYKEHKKWLYLFDYEELSELDRSSIDRICLENKINNKFIS